jgi:hypothetical protein
MVKFLVVTERGRGGVVNVRMVIDATVDYVGYGRSLARRVVVGLMGLVRRGSITKWKVGFSVVAFLRLTKNARITVSIVVFWIGIG